MVSLCQYQNLFGKPDTGIHSYRIANIAVIDVIVTFIMAYFLSMFFPQFPTYVFIIGFFLLGIIIHRIFCVRTTIDKLLFP
uniref:Uncharacterized protein n=1 Tax=viral metagenome TaxID=1070528 RepID=A0A6C0CKC8_9ZZZZ